jgi:serine/threonine protein phosphatase 1
MIHTYAIGDIHGHLDLLKQAHDRIAHDQARYGAAPTVHIGDLVDRGPDCRGVIDYLVAGIQGGQDWVVLKGNHDRMFAGYLDDLQWRDPGLRPDMSWLHPRIGGAETLKSYGIRNPADRPLAPVHAEALAAVPPAHRRFLQGLPISHVRGEAIFVHAGLRPGVPLDQQSETDMVWIRQPFLDDPRDHGALIVHGHTAIEQATHHGNRVNLDSGAAYGGPLSAVVIEGREAFELTASGRMRLLPHRTI